MLEEKEETEAARKAPLTREQQQKSVYPETRYRNEKTGSHFETERHVPALSGGFCYEVNSCILTVCQRTKRESAGACTKGTPGFVLKTVLFLWILAIDSMSGVTMDLENQAPFLAHYGQTLLSLIAIVLSTYVLLTRRKKVQEVTSQYEGIASQNGMTSQQRITLHQQMTSQPEKTPQQRNALNHWMTNAANHVAHDSGVTTGTSLFQEFCFHSADDHAQQ